MKYSKSGSVNAAFIDFSAQLPKYVREMTYSASQIEEACTQIRAAMRKPPITESDDNVIRQGLMENILRRDMNLLLAGVVRVKRSLLESVRILRDSSQKVLAAYDAHREGSTESSLAMERAEVEFAESYKMLIELEVRLSCD